MPQKIMEAETVCAIYQDNLKLCSIADRSVIQHFITCLEKNGKKLEYLKFLKVWWQINWSFGVLSVLVVN